MLMKRTKRGRDGVAALLLLTAEGVSCLFLFNNLTSGRRPPSDSALIPPGPETFQLAIDRLPSKVVGPNFIF